MSHKHRHKDCCYEYEYVKKSSCCCNQNRQCNHDCGCNQCCGGNSFLGNNNNFLLPLVLVALFCKR